MTYEEVLEQLKALGDPRAIKSWKNLGFSTENYLGVGLTKLRKLSQKVKKNHDLALQLWKSGIHDARILATFIEEPKKVTWDQIEKQFRDLDFLDLSDKFCSNVVAKTPFIRECIEKWKEDSEEIPKRCANMLLCEESKDGKNEPDQYFENYLNTIEKTIQSEMNWVKEAMIYALIGIGQRNKKLNKMAVSAARRIGPVQVNYGDTQCEAPDAIKHLTSDKLKVKLQKN